MSDAAVRIPTTGQHAAVSPPPEITGSWFARHDVGVVLVAVALLAAGVVAQAATARPRFNAYAKNGVLLRYPAGWLAEPAEGGVTFHGEDAVTRLEIKVGPAPALAVNPEAALELSRARAYGGLYDRLDTAHRTIHGADVVRTTYSYAFKPSDGHAPRLAYAVEYAVPAPGRLVVVTLHGAEERVTELEPDVLGSLEVKP